MAYIGIEQINDYIEVKTARKAELENELIKVNAEISVANDFATLCLVELDTTEGEADTATEGESEGVAQQQTY